MGQWRMGSSRSPVAEERAAGARGMPGMEGGLPAVTKHPHRRREEDRPPPRRGPPELAGCRAWRELAGARLGGRHEPFGTKFVSGRAMTCAHLDGLVGNALQHFSNSQEEENFGRPPDILVEYMARA
uniref:Uncharacterized protein n=1 Tax=Oryza meridionalis TaxID=40149 RepID=A0A0E0ERT1_9ORYZ